MSQLTNRKQVSVFENIYDRHSAQLYGIIMKISPDPNVADEILIRSFKSFFRQAPTPGTGDRVFLDLLGITLRIASKKMNLSKRHITRILFEELEHMKRWSKQPA